LLSVAPAAAPSAGHDVVAAVRRAVETGAYEPAWALVHAVHPLLTHAGDHPYWLALWGDAATAATALGDELRRAALTGVADGWLPARSADMGGDLLATADALVDRHGYVTQVCGSPDFAHPGTSPEAQAFHLLARAALR
jgi:unsaturated rhamnogalacturonyl hydrolase